MAGWLVGVLTMTPALTACGQKGPLYLPGAPSAAGTTAPVPAAATPAPAPAPASSPSPATPKN